MNERYAIYYAPDESSLLWQKACVWVGRDPVSGEVLPQAHPEALAPARFADLTEDARRYGFHATLRSPFRLADGCDRARLEDQMARFASRTAPVDLGRAEIRNLMGFLAVMPETQSAALSGFAANCVAGFETCRAPLTEAQRARRLKAGLTARQTELLDQYGYPYVMEEFRFHMTLTDRLPPDDHDLLFPAAQAYFAEALAEPVIATTNLNGDYLSDALAAQVGGLGLAPGMNKGAELTLYEPTHGTAPSFAGLDKANPGSLILSGALMLEELGWTEAAERVHKAVEHAIAAKTVTVDLARQMEGARQVGCKEFGEILIKTL